MTPAAQEVMWSLVLTVMLLGCSSEASVTCKDENNGEVDWFIIYKAPTQADKNSKLSGLEYFYIDSAQKSKYFLDPKKKLINHAEGVLANTLRPLFTPVRNMAPNFGFISYSDQPPGCSSQDTFGHSKGVVMMEKDGTGVWLLHSTPQFPFRRDQNKFWPKSGNRNAQTFICVTFPYAQFEKIGEHLQDIRAFPFDHDVPLDFYDTLQQAVKWEQIPPARPPQADFKEQISSGGQTFYSIAKNVKTKARTGQKRGRDEDETLTQSGAADGDLYVTIAHHSKVQSNLTVQSWGCQKERAKSYCGGTYNVYNTEYLNTTMGSWNRTRDHSKWCVTMGTNKYWTCIADVNRSQSQFERRGGALCINNQKVTETFRSFIADKKDCSDPEPQDSECEMDVDS